MNIETMNKQITMGWMDRHAPKPELPEVVRQNFYHDHIARVMKAHKYNGQATTEEVSRQIKQTSIHCRTISPC